MTRPTSLALALMFVATGAGAQVGTGHYGTSKTASGAKKGVQAAPEPAATRVPRSNPSSPSSGLSASAPQPVFFKFVPAVVMSDGSILADFGFGLEQVRRPCSGIVVAPGKVISGNGQVLSQPAQTQPAPTLQPAPGMQPAPAASSLSQRPLSRAASASCFRRDASGRVFVTQ